MNKDQVTCPRSRMLLATIYCSCTDTYNMYKTPLKSASASPLKSLQETSFKLCWLLSGDSNHGWFPSGASNKSQGSLHYRIIFVIFVGAAQLVEFNSVNNIGGGILLQLPTCPKEMMAATATLTTP